MPSIKKVDHLVITVSKIKVCLDFYQKLGFTPKEGDGRYELFAGDFKINVHILGHELSPHAQNVQTGSADLCFEIDGSIEQYKKDIEANGIEILLGIVTRAGARGTMQSIYLRDPDQNLLEFSSYE